MNIIKFLCDNKICVSSGEARRVVQCGGIKINGNRIDDSNYTVSSNDVRNSVIVIKKGKKAEFLVDCNVLRGDV